MQQKRNLKSMGSRKQADPFILGTLTVTNLELSRSVEAEHRAMNRRMGINLCHAAAALHSPRMTLRCEESRRSEESLPAAATVVHQTRQVLAIVLLHNDGYKPHRNVINLVVHCVF